MERQIFKDSAQGSWRLCCLVFSSVTTDGPTCCQDYTTAQLQESHQFHSSGHTVSEEVRQKNKNFFLIDSVIMDTTLPQQWSLKCFLTAVMCVLISVKYNV